MPVPVVPIIAAAGAVAGAGINAGMTGKMNRKSINFSREMYNRQQQDALANWNLQNEYNSPQAQMKRFQEAGLNPNLIYGQGNSGPSGNLAVPDVQSPQFRAPEWGNALQGGMSTLSQMYDLEIKQAQVDNMKSQKSVIDAEALLKLEQIASTRAGTNRSKFDLDLDTELRPISADARREALRQTKTSTDIALNRDAREAALNASSVQEAAERMLTLIDNRKTAALSRAHTRADIARVNETTAQIKQSIVNAQKDGTLKDLEIELRKMGLSPNSPMWSTVVGRVLSGTSTIPSFLQRLFGSD